MAHHFKQMKLLNDQDKWVPGLEGIAEKLLPKTVEISDLKTLIDQMAVCAARNPYLHRVVEEAAKQNLGDFFIKKSQDEPNILRNVVAYAMVLNNLTVAMRNDIGITKTCRDWWIKERSKLSIFSSTFGLFDWVKIETVEKISLKNSMDIIETQIMDPNNSRYSLPLNILEATLKDIFGGNFNNASAGWVLAKNCPGGSLNTATGSGPANFSDDKKAIIHHMPLEKKWTDLYATWNLGFVSEYEVFPYVMAKLLIPQVNNYEKIPGEYIHNRGRALYITLNYMCFGDSKIASDINLKSFNWKNQEFTNIFGKINAESAREYQAEVDNSPSAKVSSVVDFKSSIL